VSTAVVPRPLVPTRIPAAAAKRPARLELDLAAIGLGVLVALRGQTHTHLLTAALLIAGYPIVVLSLLGRRSHTWEDGSLLDEVRRLLTATLTAALAVIGTDAILGGSADVPLGLRIWLCTLALLLTGRFVFHHMRARMPLAVGRPTLIVGAGRVGGELARYLHAEPRHELRPVGFLEYQSEPRLAAVGARPLTLPVVGSPDDLDAAVARTGAECVAIAFALATDEHLLPLLEQCERLGIRTFVVPRLFEALGWRMRIRQVGSMPLGELAPLAPRDLRFAVKHLLDRLVALALLTALAPLLAGIAALIKLSSPGGVFFRQRRIGRDGREFEMFKFRTMYEAGGVSAFEPPEGCAPGGVEDEDRRTPVGIWLRRPSLDELPQLINVLRGEMSLIGPRPERPEYVRRFGAELRRYERRHRVKSGITGLAQVSGLRGQTSIARRAEYDNFYIQNWSFWLDFKILLRTVKVVLSLGGE
jgi:exopolysaccharide biosynthesis polyprenyl glycosylphosphotransferase